MSDAHLFAVVSDLHAGSTVALCPPKVELDDGGAYLASKAQLWLWQCWRDVWVEVERIRDAEGATLEVVVNGDAFDGDHHDTPQILSRNPVAARAVIDAALEIPLSLKPDRIAIIRGTEAHVGKSGSSEEALAKSLHGRGHPVLMDEQAGTYSHYHLRRKVGWFRIAFAHHGRTGYRPWTKANAANLLAAQIFYEYSKLAAENGGPIEFPHVAVRSHFHKLNDSGSAHPVRVIQTHAWQLPTAFVHRIAAEELPQLADVGAVLILVRGKSYDVRFLTFHPETDPWIE